MPQEQPLHKNLFLIGMIAALGAIILVVNVFDNIRWLFIDYSGYDQAEGMIIVSETEYKAGLASHALHFNIWYRYTVNGIEYVSNRVHHGYTGSNSDGPGYAKGYVTKYPVGKQIVVFFDPDKPQYSVLEPEIRQYSAISLSIIMIALTCFFLVSSIFAYTRSRRTSG